MDSFEINKIVAAVLMVALLVIGIGKLSDVIFHVEKPETPGYSVEVETATTISTASSSTTSDNFPIPITSKATIKTAATILFISKESIFSKFCSERIT